VDLIELAQFVGSKDGSFSPDKGTKLVASAIRCIENEIRMHSPFTK
jgi:hypothetical protein